MSGRARALAACTRGATAVEFAIVAGVLIMLLLGIVEFGRAWFITNQISFLADRAVRQVLIQPDISVAELEAELRDGFFAGDPDALAIDVTWQTADGVTYRQITIGFPLTLFVPFLDSNTVALNVKRRVPAG